MASSERAYQAISRSAIARRDASVPGEYLLPESRLANLPKDLTTIPRKSDHFTAEERKIITSPVGDILSRIHSRRWTSEVVTRAFLKSAAVAQQLTNCLTALLADTAIERAKELDRHLQETGRVAGPLHGLPVSLKDCFITPPVPTAIGLAAYADKPTTADEESVLTQLIRDVGAVVHAKTNVPPGMMAMETDNYVYGTTSNPYNTNCSPGGSSGGEGALIAMCGSPIGVGTDIGGSIRIPSAFTGLYGLKPSFGRFPSYGTRSGIPGNDFILAVNGPMCVQLEDLETYCAALLSKHMEFEPPWFRDPKCFPLPWQNEVVKSVQGKKLRLGFMPPQDGIVHAHPPVERALSIMRAACEEAGYECVTWEAEGHAELLQSVQNGFLGLGGPAIGKKLVEADEPHLPGMKAYMDAWDKDQAARKGGSVEGILTAEQLREMNLIRNSVQKKHLDRWRKAGIDALIAPASPFSAPRKGFTTRDPGLPYYGFTAVFSLLDVSGCTIPVTEVQSGLDKAWGDDCKRPEPFNDLDKGIANGWDPEIYEGTPVGLQVLAGRLEEEKLLGMVKELEKALHKHLDKGFAWRAKG